MITRISIEGFRGVRKGSVEGLAPISILVGPNNSGKSTVLEAVAASLYEEEATEVAKLILRRGGPPLDALSHSLFSGSESATLESELEGPAPRVQFLSRISLPKGRPAEAVNHAYSEGLTEPMRLLTVVAERGGGVIAEVSCFVGEDARTSINWLQRGAFTSTRKQVRFVDVQTARGDGALEDAYTRIDEAGQLPKVVKALGRSMAGLMDLRILKVGQKFVLNASFASGPPVPVYLSGDGFKRFLELAAATVSTPKGTVLLEEPEAFQHPRYLQELATLLHLSAQEGTQVVLSTHSIELIDLLLNAPEAEGKPYPSVHRLVLRDGHLRATTIGRESAVNARTSLLEDLRA